MLTGKQRAQLRSMAMELDTILQIGKSGVTVTDLRPAGKISVDELVLDVISAGPFIEKGKPVKIIKVSNNSLMVCETDGK